MDAQQPARDHRHDDTEAPPPDDGDDPLPGRRQDHQVPPRRCRGVPWVTVMGFLFLTLNSGMAIYRSNGEPRAVAFVAFSYLDLILLFACLRWYESAQPADSVTKSRLKVAVWLLTTALTLVFSAKVAAVMPPAVALVVWLMAFATVAGGFYVFFLHGDKQ